MPDITYILLGLQIAGFGVFWWQYRATEKALHDLEAGRARADAQIASLLTRSDRRVIGSEAALIEEWRAEMEAQPEGSPRREAYLARLRDLGAL